MNKEAIKPISEFMESHPPQGVYFLNTQFGKINYLSGEVCATISTRLNASGKDFIIYNNMSSKKTSLPPELEGKKFRIRKLTPRECFRLMGVDDADIDKMQASGLSNSAQYKLAGNSIVVDVLFHIFRKMFVETDRDTTKGQAEQLTLF